MRPSFLAPAAIAAAVSAPAFAGDYDDAEFYAPTGWNVGDAGSTYQGWAEFTTATAEPDAGEWNANPTVATAPTLRILSPGFVPGAGRSYSFGGDYGAAVDVSNVAPAATGLGTHVILQVGASVNVDSVFLSSVRILDDDGNLITDGGENADALQATHFGTRVVDTIMGDGTFQESIVEFFLPGYTDDFTVTWNQKVHTGIDAVRVDTFQSAAALPITAVPEPASLALVAAGALLALRRR